MNIITFMHERVYIQQKQNNFNTIKTLHLLIENVKEWIPVLFI